MGAEAVFEKPVVQAFINAACKRSYSPKFNIVNAGEAPHTLYLILEGAVSVLVEDEAGRELVLAYLKSGEFFGEMCLFPQQEVRTAIVRTRQATLVAEVGFEAFRKFNHDHPDIMYEVAGQLAARLRDTSRRLRDLTFLDVAGRIARTLLDFSREPDAKKGPRGVILRISRQELARLVGCSREMAGRVLKKLEEDGLVICEGRNVLVPTGSGLADFRTHKPA